MIFGQVEITAERYTDETRDIIRCLRVLYGSRAGEQALDRDFGLNRDFLDLPLAAAKARLTADLIEKTLKYEPRAKIKKVSFEADAASGALFPKVVLA